MILVWRLAAERRTDAESEVERLDRRPRRLVSVSLFVLAADVAAEAGKALGSRALAADSFQTSACFRLSLITLTGVGLNSTLVWWWADPIAALGMTGFLVREGLEGRRGRRAAGSRALRRGGTAGPPLTVGSNDAIFRVVTK